MTYAVYALRNQYGERVYRVRDWPCTEDGAERISAVYQSRQSADMALERRLQRMEAALISASRLEGSRWFIDVIDKEGRI